LVVRAKRARESSSLPLSPLAHNPLLVRFLSFSWVRETKRKKMNKPESAKQN